MDRAVRTDCQGGRQAESPRARSSTAKRLSSATPGSRTSRRCAAKSGNRESKRLLYHAFDLLYLNGADLRPATLLERKHALKSVLQKAPSYISLRRLLGRRRVPHLPARLSYGIGRHRRKACGRRLSFGTPGQLDQAQVHQERYVSDRRFVEKLGAKPRKIASLYVGRWEGDRLLYAGKARSGYTETVAREVRERLDPLIRKTAPLSDQVKKPKATWVEPLVNAEIEYSAVTDDGLLRAAVFKGLRDDLEKPRRAGDLIRRRRSPTLSPQRPSARSVHGVPRENILQLLPDAVSPSKEELTSYWKKVAKRALVHLAGRPLKLVRHTHGITFYHRGRLPEIPPAVHQLHIRKREGGEGVRLWIDDLDGLLGLVAMDAVELHPWNATVDDIEHADRLVIDLDPAEDVEWDLVVDTALMLRNLLHTEGLNPWPKVTGGKGLHLMSPLEKPMPHDAARRYARRLVQRLVHKNPKRYLISASPAARGGKIFLDYLRNGRGNTAIGTYSPRARPYLPIAAPVTWRQVEEGLRPDAFTMDAPFRRTKHAAD